MGSLWRSEDMTLVQMTMQRDAAHDTVDKLGELGLVEFKDVCVFYVCELIGTDSFCLSVIRTLERVSKTVRKPSEEM